MYSWEKIAARYGMKLGDKFNILDGQWSYSSPYEFRANGIFDKYGDKYSSPLHELEKGNYEKVGEIKWEYMEQ